jgi:hypothetical protein
MADVVSAVFDSRSDAEQAVQWLRNQGVSDNAISVVSQQGDTTRATGGVVDADDGDEAADAGKGALTGAAVGAGVGALFGLAAAAIPGIGPFITAGALANALGVTGGAAAAGAIVGGTSGGIAGALSGWGVSETESKYYASEIERGGTWVGVDLDNVTVDRPTVTEAFRRYNGRFSTMQRAA